MTREVARAEDHRLGGLIAVCVAGVIWGTIGPGVRLLHEWSGLSPWVITAYRAAIAVLAVLLATLVGRRLTSTWDAARQQWRRIVVLGVLTAVFQLLFFIGVIAAGASVTTVVCLGFAPVLLLVLGSVRERRLPPASRALTVSIAVVGLLLVSLVGSAGDPMPHPLLGIVVALASGTAYALSAEVAKPLAHQLDPQTQTTATMCVAAVLLVPGGLLAGALRGETLIATDLKSWLALVYLGAFTMAFAYAVFYAGLRGMSSGAAMVATLIEPVSAVVLAVIFLHERLSVAGVIGCLLILSAIVGLGYRPKKTASGARPEPADPPPPL